MCDYVDSGIREPSPEALERAPELAGNHPSHKGNEECNYGEIAVLVVRDKCIGFLFFD
jgi:hypothetical protein